MVNQTLVDYIKSVKAQGFNDTAVVEALRKNGWKDTDIQEAYASFSLSSQTPMAPSAPTPSALPSYKVEPKTISTEQPIKKVIVEEEYNSPFSVGLAVVLFISLFVLVNKIIHDIGLNATSENSTLIFDAIITIPFLFASFMLYGIASQNKKRFIIICQPYFIVSAFLFLRLLWNVSKYILNTNATYGVYIVLVMAILVLTGFVIFLQKFLKS